MPTLHQWCPPGVTENSSAAYQLEGIHFEVHPRPTSIRSGTRSELFADCHDVRTSRRRHESPGAPRGTTARWKKAMSAQDRDSCRIRGLR